MKGRRLSRWTFATIAVASLCVGCNAIIGGAFAVVGITAAIVFKGCDDYVGVTLRRQGQVVCDADVIARSEGREVDFSPCFSAYLPDGTWTIEATTLGGARATSTVVVEHPGACEPSVHTVELTVPAATSQAPAGGTHDEIPVD